ncbi:TNF receptor-associated factor family protein DDB_G0272098-like isoform X1 [Neodiprion virginianus]|uniref:TNF receptor-associated factor family protein DDB_G0272098-like isoform X1 n=2 Tax=Neodiprion fabricii TaxID=2872261 RepID=UPI001ED90BE0|nr:TNF receptor-associated factor family protein DDB_G0272098-like isoform X1 [Neodiprion fabricii]XP_046627449.1 TNF receptor-associated factor family protein DDB_G0272098-like isoform X1 [Neodiprion virginianus]XP_046627450.1 TNF receptor-associated factor family protein DDB_G0272098-like isoform X1 [Neodiprion virginianus]
MPGIRISGIGKSDRTGQVQAQPTLNVPGSYWLSNKQNIYKFTFKYNEPTRYTKEFPYKEELMKIIRRIIKSQPSQGELSTVHLSITYKHTFWTRQDKMFAMLKFCNRQGAAAFPQAFILTISIVDNMANQTSGPRITQGDLDLRCPNSNVFQSSTVLSSPVATTVSDKTILPWAEANINRTRLSRHPGCNNELTKTEIVAVDVSASKRTCAGSDFDGFRNVHESLEGTTTKCISGVGMQWLDTRTTIQSQVKKYHNTQLVTADDSVEYSQDTYSAHPRTERDELSNIQVTGNTNKDKGDQEIEGLRKESQQIYPRSLNITDLVMGGLMFTIKQDENNVKVVEQRTKMELDEVLENSEKIETKEGSRCLVNSSLLGLENLVTNIEIPDSHLKILRTTNISPTVDYETFLPYDIRENRGGMATGGVLPVRSSVDDERTDLIRCNSQSLMESYNDIDNVDISNADKNGNNKNINDNDNNNNYNINTSINNITASNVHIDMWKLLHDMTRGAKVVVERISDADVRNAKKPLTNQESANTGSSACTLPSSINRRWLEM